MSSSVFLSSIRLSFVLECNGVPSVFSLFSVVTLGMIRLRQDARYVSDHPCLRMLPACYVTHLGILYPATSAANSSLGPSLRISWRWLKTPLGRYCATCCPCGRCLVAQRIKGFRVMTCVRHVIQAVDAQVLCRVLHQEHC